MDAGAVHPQEQHLQYVILSSWPDDSPGHWGLNHLESLSSTNSNMLVWRYWHFHFVARQHIRCARCESPSPFSKRSSCGVPDRCSAPVVLHFLPSFSSVFASLYVQIADCADGHFWSRTARSHDEYCHQWQMDTSSITFSRVFCYTVTSCYFLLLSFQSRQQ